MSEENYVGLYHEPEPSEIDFWEQRADGRWYLKEAPTEVGGGAKTIHVDTPDEYIFTPGATRFFEPTPDHPVGDINSDERGTGARTLGADKVRVEYIPVRLWLQIMIMNGYDQEDMIKRALLLSLNKLALFQEGKGRAINAMTPFTSEDFDDACAVFHFGAAKYKAWNWLKGMPYSVVTGCAMRHARAIMEGELIDPQSGETHLGHYICNLVMLATFETTYPEGDDRPRPEYFNG